MSRHEPWVDQLSDFLDDELPDDERAAVESHLALCAECTATLAALRRVVAGASSLASRAPERDLWPGIALRMTGPARRVSFTLPQLAAASLLLATLSGGAVALFLSARDQNPGANAAVPAVDIVQPVESSLDGLALAVSVADAQYDAAVADLERALEGGRGRLDEITVSVVEQNLSIIDRAIAEARSALAADPSNGYLSGHLLEARRRKLDLLRRAAALTEAN
ncbi:MAG: hypothetical protein A3H97_08410 [Acidobacteria bacterium RIFCSPLOWO2_02_FULL_65_29]|nr:MAG: hypothetical protein A3H97_08410 [Acidobacteria bacterium RIFCSPLOWO2_02_FULL_65_29]